MATDDERERLRSYLAAQSAKLSAGEIGARLQEAAGQFFATLEGVDAATAQRRPADGEWSIAEIVDHVALTLDDAADIIRSLARGIHPGRVMTEHTPVNAPVPLPELVQRLRRSQAALAELLAVQPGERYTDLRIADHDFGEINWKGYALILRLHYRDHAQQVLKTLEAVRGTSACSSEDSLA